MTKKTARLGLGTLALVTCTNIQTFAAEPVPANCPETLAPGQSCVEIDLMSCTVASGRRAADVPIWPAATVRDGHCRLTVEDMSCNLLAALEHVVIVAREREKKTADSSRWDIRASFDLSLCKKDPNLRHISATPTRESIDRVPLLNATTAGKSAE